MQKDFINIKIVLLYNQKFLIKLITVLCHFFAKVITHSKFEFSASSEVESQNCVSIHPPICSTLLAKLLKHMSPYCIQWLPTTRGVL